MRGDDLADRRLDAFVEHPPASVGSERRVVRLTSSTPTARSSAISERLRDCNGRRRWREAAAWLPRSMIARKASRSSNRSTSEYRFSECCIAGMQPLTGPQYPPSACKQIGAGCGGSADILQGPSHRIIAYPTGQPFSSHKERSCTLSRVVSDTGPAGHNVLAISVACAHGRLEPFRSDRIGTEL